MSRVIVPLGERSYDVLVEAGLAGQAAEAIGRVATKGRLFIVSDEKVWALHGERLLGGLGRWSVEAHIVPAGESSKSWAELERLVQSLLDRGIERNDHVVAFGGGVVGDLAGFAAAIAKRGCPWIYLPTTLLAQVDSSVGGKTGINVGAGKNLVGAFHQPSLVLIDPELLASLPGRELRAGYAEVVKYGLLGDPDFFAWCEANAAALLAGDQEAQRHAILASVAAKARIVAHDEQDRNDRRALLNLGHTFGHALEAEAGWSDRLLHGEAVAAGIALAFRLSARLGLCPSADAQRVTEHLRSRGLPTGSQAEPAALVERMRQDKKRESGRMVLILARGIGRAFVERNVDPAEVNAFLHEDARQLTPAQDER